MEYTDRMPESAQTGVGESGTTTDLQQVLHLLLEELELALVVFFLYQPGIY